MSELTDFLLARIAEDEAVARAAIEDDGGSVGGFEDAADRLTWKFNDPQPNRFGAAAARLIAHTAVPRRVMAECEAKRRIVCEYVGEIERGPAGGRADFVARHGAILDAYRVAVQALASVYADHPDYRDEWRP